METVRRESVRVAVLDEQGRVLLLHAVLPYEAWWELPGGGVQPTETYEAAATRELAEETGIEVERVRPLGVVDTEFVFDGRRYLQRESVFLASADDPRVSLADPDPAPGLRHAEYRWWSLAELGETEEHIHPPQLAELLVEAF